MACSATQAGGGAAETAGSECRIEGSVVVHAAGLGGKRWGAAVFCSTCGGGAGEVHGSLALAARTCMALFSNTWHLRGTHRGPATRNTSPRCCRRNGDAAKGGVIATWFLVGFQRFFERDRTGAPTIEDRTRACGSTRGTTRLREV
jgi:hypothetical protein